MAIKYRNHGQRAKPQPAVARPRVGDSGITKGPHMDTPTLLPVDAPADEAIQVPDLDEMRAQRAEAMQIAEETLAAIQALDAAIARAAKDDEDEEDEPEDEDDAEEGDGEENEAEDEDEEEAPAPKAKQRAQTAEDLDPAELLRQARETYIQVAQVNGLDVDAALLGVQATPTVSETALTRAITVVEAQQATPVGVIEVGFIPINRRDDEHRIIEGVLSNEEPDTFGTIFDYESMKRAVTDRYPGNVREQHDPKKAVGKALQFFFDDDKREVRMRAQISQAATDTWTKIQEGVLRGFSIGAANARTENRMIGGKSYPCYVDYGLAETSVVDAPANYGAAQSGLTIMRAAVAEILAPDETVSAAEPLPQTPVAPVSEQRAQESVLAPALVTPTAQADPILTRAELGDTMSGQPGIGGPAIDHEAITTAMHQDEGYTHLHAHPYDETTVHSNDHTHEHLDGTKHKHAHSHSHVGSGDGSRPHVHLHEHDHQYRTMAPDLVRTQSGYVTDPTAFIGQDDVRVATYAPQQQRATTPAALPTVVAETSGTPSSTPTPVTVAPRVQAAETARIGQRISSDTQAGLHEGALAILRTCNCPVCQQAILCYDPDNDGDDDVDMAGDTDGDMGRVQRARLTRAVARIVQAQTQPLLRQFAAIAARLTSVPSTPSAAPDLTRVQAQLDDLRSVVTGVATLVGKIAEQEQGSAPVLRSMDSPAQRLASQHADQWTQQDVASLNKAAQRGLLTPQDQVQLAASIITQQQGL